MQNRKQQRDKGKENDENNENPMNPYARYSGMAVQMIVIIAAGSYGGYRADKWLHLSFPIFTLVLSLGAVTLAIWLFIKGFNNNNNTHE